MYVKCDNSLMTSCNSATNDENTNILPRLKRNKLPPYLLSAIFQGKMKEIWKITRPLGAQNWKERGILLLLLRSSFLFVNNAALLARIKQESKKSEELAKTETTGNKEIPSRSRIIRPLSLFSWYHNASRRNTLEILIWVQTREGV